MKTGLILLIFLAVIVVLVAGCTSPSPVISPTPLPTAQTPSATPVLATPTVTPQATSTPVPTATPAPTTASVSISGFAFKPENVTIAQGGTVSWTNDEDTVHSIKFTDGESPNLPKGVTYNKKFDTTGTFEYHCGIHPYMKGRVTVV